MFAQTRGEGAGQLTAGDADRTVEQVLLRRLWQGFKPVQKILVADAGEPADVAGDQVPFIDSPANHVLADAELLSGLRVVICDLGAH